MFCSNCGTKLDDGAKFCTNCGKRVEIPAPVQQEKKEESPIPFVPEINVSPVSDTAPASDAVQEIKEEALPVTEEIASAEETAEEAAQTVEETVEETAGAVEEAVAEAEEKAEEIVSEIPEQVSAAAEAVKEEVSAAAEAAPVVNEAPKMPEQPVYQQPPVYGQPVYGQPQYGQPQYGQQQYAQPQYAQPQQQYGQPQPQQMQYAQPQYNQYGQPQYGQPQYFDQYGRPVYFYPQQNAPVGPKKSMVWHYIFTCGVLLLTIAMLVMFAVFSPYGMAYTEYRTIDYGDNFGEILEEIDDFIEFSYDCDDTFKIVDISARIVSGLLVFWGMAIFMLLIMKKKASYGNLIGFGIVLFLLNLGYFLYWLFGYSFEILSDSAWTLFQFPVFALAGLVIMIINCVYYAKRKHQLK